MSKTITIGTKAEDDPLINAILEFQHSNSLRTAPDAVRVLCRQALQLTTVTIKVS